MFKEGQVLIEQKSYEKAKAKYKEILALDDKNQLAPRKLDQIDRLIEKAEAEKTKVQDFQRLVDEGDVLFKANDWAAAAEKYGAALLKIKDKVVEDKYNKAKAAMIKDEADALVKQRYDKAIKAADDALAAGNLDDAKAKYKQAQLFDEANPYPRQKIKSIEEQQNASQQKLAAYEAAMKKGNAAMSIEKFEEAILAFTDASKVMPEETLPKELIKEAQRRIDENKGEKDQQYEKILTVAQKKMNEGDLDKAVELFNRAKSFRPEDPRPDEYLAKIALFKKTEKDFNDKMAQADQAANNKLYDQAIGFYEQARDIKPKEPLPNERIAALKKIRDANANAAQKEMRYNEEFGKGMKAFAAREYVTALSFFDKAMDYRENDQACQDKIAEIKQILDEQEKANTANAEKKKAYDKFIARADKLFEEEKWQEAKDVYGQALAIDFKSPYAKRQVEECVAQMKAARYKEQEALYRKIIGAGDKNMTAQDYTKAIDYYGRAVKMRPDDPYPRAKLQEIDNILNPKIVDNGKLQPLGDAFEGDAALELAKAKADLEGESYGELEDVVDKVESDYQVNAMFDKNGNLKAQESMDYAKTEIRKDNQDFDDAEKQSLNAARQEILLMNRSKEKMESDYDQTQTNISTAMNQTTLDVEQRAGNDDAERQRTADQIHGYVQDQESKQLGYGNEAYETGQTNKAEVNSQIAKNAQKDAADMKKAGYNNSEIVDVQREVLEQSGLNAQASDNQSANVVQAIDQLQERLMGEESERTGNSSENGAEVNDLRQEVVNQLEDIGEKENELALNQQRTIQNTRNKVDDQARNAKLEQESNALELDDVRRETLRQKSENARKDQYDGTNTQLAVDDVNRKVEANSIQSSENQYQNKDKVIALKNEVNNQEADLITENTQNSRTINREADEVRNAIGEKNIQEVKSPRANNLEVEDAEDKVVNETASNSKMAKENQMNNRTGGETLIETVEEDAYRSTKKQEVNQRTVQDMKAEANKQLTDRSAETTKKQQNQQAEIDDVDPQPKREYAKNSLGQEYPEGVTEENFSRKDSKGRLREVLTRRIVVVEGHGDVYIRSQSSSGITYTKNGNSITKHVWQKETQGSNLQRN